MWSWLANLDGWRRAVNGICRPEILLPAAGAMVALMVAGYRRWTRPRVAGAILAAGAAGFGGMLVEGNFRALAGRADNIPIVMLLGAVAIALAVALRRAARHDGGLEGAAGDRTALVWPDLVYIELICLLLVTAGLIVWSILVKAPLEGPANPAMAPNPIKAPWYFVGLQELLVYFDPWLAGVVYPGLIIFGLCAIPFLDRNPRGSGYYSLAGRRFGVMVFLLGFVVLWLMPIVIGTFLRGPNWSVFGPFEPWDIHKYDAGRSIDLSQWWWSGVLGKARPAHWLAREWAGLGLLAIYLLILPAALRFTLLKRRYEQMGFARYSVMIFLLLMMALLPMKMLLRWVFHVKYLVWLPEFGASV